MKNKVKRAGVVAAVVAEHLRAERSEGSDDGSLQEGLCDKVHERLKSAKVLSRLRHTKVAISETHQAITESSEPEYRNLLNEYTKDMDNEDRMSVIHFAVFQLDISDEADVLSKKIIEDICKYIEINECFFDVMESYHESEFEKNGINKAVLAVPVAALVLLFSWIHLTGESEPEINLFDTSKVYYLTVPFNQYVIYHNRFNETSSFPRRTNQWYRKRAVFYLHGEANIGFDPQYLEYNSATGTLTVTKNLSELLTASVTTEAVLIDQVDPRSVSDDDASLLAAGVGITTGIAGTVGGAMLGGKLASVVPGVTPVQGMAAGGLVGGVASGAAGYLISSRALDSASVSKEITERERETAITEARNLLNGILTPEYQLSDNSTDLGVMYRARFESYLEARYAKYGMSIRVVYAEGVYGNE